jgi:single-strand DNA-binding protein
MASLNSVSIIGNVGKEAEMRFTPSGKPVTSFSVAVNSKFGETESTEWFNIVTWNKLAETCNQYLVKGQQVYVEGRLQTRTWEGDDEVKHYKTEVVANKVLFLGQRKQESEDTGEDLF